jgi:type II secretory pathway pseudopilin PulG
MGRRSRPGSRMSARRTLQSGFTYIGILVTVVIVGLMLTVVGRIWSVSEQRERETQLLFVGDEFRMAISRYFASGHQYPLSLELLLADDRSPVPKRYLRRLYVDPMTGNADWTLIYASDGVGIMGVASTSKLTPIKRKGFSDVDAAFEDSDCYCSWRFVYIPRTYYSRPATPAAAPTTPTHPTQPTVPTVPTRPIVPTVHGAR